MSVKMLTIILYARTDFVHLGYIPAEDMMTMMDLYYG